MRKRKRASENLKHTVCVCAYVCVFLMVFSFNTLLWFLNREDTHLLRQRVGILDSSGIVASFLNNLPACWQVLALGGTMHQDWWLQKCTQKLRQDSE